MQTEIKKVYSGRADNGFACGGEIVTARLERASSYAGLGMELTQRHNTTGGKRYQRRCNDSL